MIKYLGLGAASQALISLTNLALSAALLAVQTKEQFGEFSLGLAAAYAASGLIVSLLSPYSTIYRREGGLKQTAEARQFATLTAYCALTVIALGILGQAGLIFAGWNWPAFDCALAASSYTFRESLVRLAHSRRAEVIILKSSAVLSITTALAMSAVVIVCEPSTANALRSFSLGHLAAGACLYLGVVGTTASTSKGATKLLRRLWSRGLKNALGSFTYSLRTQAHNFVTAPLLGLSAVAEINAGRMLLQPIFVAMPVLSSVLTPRLTPMPADLTRLSIISGAVVVGAAVYGVILLAALTAFPYAGQYENLSAVSVAWAVVSVAVGARTCAYIYAEICDCYHQIALANIGASILAVPVSYLAAYAYGPVGAILASGVAEALLAAFLILKVRAR